ncbi:hypothetical protein J4Q44_G00344960 [Coregonus suidteri]|uniref:Uncharacterized protein n=1 Tax=Coregonus suidteri TaxID=861788 RepID=A0AAN8L0F9_9TELE
MVLHYRDRMVQRPPEPSDQLPAISPEHSKVSLLGCGTLEQPIKKPADSSLRKDATIKA